MRAPPRRPVSWLLLLFVGSLSLPFAAHAAATQSTAARPFDADWRFTRGDPTGAEVPGFDDRAWRILDLPHDWSIEGPYDEDAPTGGPGGYLPTGLGWYRKSFTLPAAEHDRSVSLRFGGIYQHSTVWINGHRLGFRPYGYSSFHYDLTPHLRWDGQPNVLAVRVDNSQQPNSRWYSGSGIYRRVWLTVTDPLRVPEWGTYVTTPEATPERARVRVRVQVRNDQPTEQATRLRNEIIRADGEVVARLDAAQRIPAHSTHTFDEEILLERPELWSPENPHLYQLRSTPTTDERAGEAYVTTFGVRTIAFTADEGFSLNGQRLKLRGMCLHHDGGAVGAAVPAAVLERRLRLLKEMGCNAVRCSHNPMASEFYDLCDQLGLLVMDEAFDEWTIRKPQIQHGYSDHFHEWSERDLVDLIHRNRNHPSIVIWSAGNEIGEQWAPEGPAILDRLVSIFHREDPTRPVTAALDNIFNQRGRAPDAFTSLLDVVGYNYVDRWGRRRETHYEDDRHAFPKRRFIGTENRSARGVRGVYAFGPLVGGGFASGRAQPPLGPSGALYLNDTINAAELWRFVATRDYIAGDFAWTGVDYLGEARWPRKLAASGPLDTCDFKKDAYFFYQSIWTDEPMVHLLPHWNWAGREGTMVPVVAYSNCDVVELFLNGRSLGAKAREFPRQGAAGGWNSYERPVVRSSTVDMQLVWDVPYEPGELRAVGNRLGEARAETVRRTAGPPTQLELTADRTELTADGRDTVHLTVRALDAQGHFMPLANNRVTFAVSGPGRLIGVDNGDPESHESYQGPHRHLFSGMALGLVQAQHDTGAIEVRVSADGLTPATLSIPVVSPGASAQPVAMATHPLLAPENLLAWCIVPFDAQRRGPQERVEMLARLGFTQYAWDWRDEHLDDLPQELRLAAARGIRMRAIWLWLDEVAEGENALSQSNRAVIEAARGAGVPVEFWLGMNETVFAGLSDAERVERGAALVRTVLEQLEGTESTVALYNHGGWFGEPENQLAIIAAVQDPRVGIVYNFHHAHHEIDEFEENLARMLPHLRAVNLNGMKPGGPKILPIGRGTHEQAMIATLLRSGYRGPIGILGHVDDADVEQVLRQNLEGLRALAH